MIRFKNASKWWELPKREFNWLVQEGENHIRDQERASKKAERDAAKAQQVEEKQKLQEEHYKLAQERQLSAARKAEYQSVVRRIRQMGGIRPFRTSGTTGKTPELEEWKDLPRSVKTRDQRRGFALDDIAQSINEEYPWLHLANGDDLWSYLTNKKNQSGPIARAWYHVPEPKPAEKPKIVISQNKSGQWIINRLYPSGEVRGDPGTYPSKAAAEKAAASQRAIGAGVVKPAMFGEEQQRRESYGVGFLADAAYSAKREPSGTGRRAFAWMAGLG